MLKPEKDNCLIYKIILFIITIYLCVYYKGPERYEVVENKGNEHWEHYLMGCSRTIKNYYHD